MKNTQGAYLCVFYSYMDNFKVAGYTHFPDNFMTNQMDLVQFEF